MRRMILVVIAAALVAVTTAAAGGRDRAQAAQSPSGPNAVTHWSLVSQNAISVGRPPASSEVLHGLVHAAIYDAVVAVEGRYEPFAVSILPSGPTSVDAAVAAAARGVLVVRVPAQAPTVETAYSAFLAGIPDGTRKTNGIRLGRAIAGAYLGLRSDDGYDNVVPWVQPPTGPGVFEPIPPTSTPVDVKLKQVRPLTFDDPARFRPDGPDSLTSADYTVDFNEVKTLGRVDSPVRTPAQTEIARFWAEHTMVQWNRTLRNLALDRHLDTLKSARMMAMVHVSAADSLVGCWEAKYYYNFWRPQHAVQRADTDGNPDTIQDATWTHLLLGNHPEYPSGHACFTSAATRALEKFFGRDRLPISVESTVTGTTRDFDRLSDVRAEVTLARIYGGLHFREAMQDGDRLGARTTRYVLRNFFDRTRGHDDD
jgi:PAP2 superfamily